MLVCGSNVPPKANVAGVLKFFDVFTAETLPELGVRRPTLFLFRVSHCLERLWTTIGSKFDFAVALDKYAMVFLIESNEQICIGFRGMK